MTPAGRSPTALRAVLVAASIALAVTVAACGTSAPTPTARPSPTGAPLASVSPTPTMVPVPTSRLAVPSASYAHLDETKKQALQTALDGILARHGYPGASAAIAFPDGTVWSGVSGYAVLSYGAPVRTETLFAVASITKTFVAALVCRLAVDGVISLNDPLSKYVPSFYNAPNIKIRQLLNHSSGIEELFDVIDAAVLARPTAVWTADRVLARVGHLTYFAPGTGYHYSNTDFVLLGLVIEKATGKTVAELIRSEFLTPLGLGHTYLQTQEQAQGPMAHGYMWPPDPIRDNFAGTMIPFTAEATAAGFAGAYASTATDLAIWAHALYGGTVLDLATLASMVDTSPSLPYKPQYPYGLGFEETTVAGHVAWGHQGHLDGFWSAMEYLPAYHVSVVILTNAEWGSSHIVADTSALATVAIA